MAGSPEVLADLVTVFHNNRNARDADELRSTLEGFEGPSFTWSAIDNRIRNRGYGPACNVGAGGGEAPVIGFLNPDVRVLGPFLQQVAGELEKPEVVIAGRRWGKPARDLDQWGLDEWVCGAALFVDRSWFEAVGGFDEIFVWSWEETDLCRRAQEMTLGVADLELPIEHESPSDDAPADRAYKRYWFRSGRDRYRKKWGHPT